MADVREKLYRDPVHDLIALDRNNREDRTIMQLIDSAEMQRLRRIRQLGLAWLAYQGAEHSRFTHSIGTMWTATRILRQLAKVRRIPERQVFATRCAALLHDVGHGPFSHAFEKHVGHDHEEWTERILLDPGCEVHHVLENYARGLARDVSRIVRGESRPRFLSQLIASQLDADRFDYLLRDSLMTGVKYGVFDLERIIHVLRIDPHGEQIVISAQGVQPVEQYLQSRYHMYRQVYLHKTVRGAEIMLGKFLTRATDLASSDELVQVDDEPLHNLLRLGPATSMEDYLKVDDHSVYTWLRRAEESRDPVLSDLARGILNRRLFKTVDLSRAKGIKARIAKATAVLRRAGADPRYYFTTDSASDTPYRPYDPREPEAAMHILGEAPGGHGKYRDIFEVSEVVAGLTRAAFRLKRAVFPAEVNGRNIRREMTEALLG
jgi:uncharacterized protein